MITDKMMEEKIIKAYGANPKRWPDFAATDIKGAPVLKDGNPKLARLLAEARLVDAALDGLPQPAPADAALRAALMAVPYRVAQERPGGRLRPGFFSWWPFGTIFGGPLPQLSSLALACLLGLAVGHFDIVGNPLVDFRSGNDLTSMALGVEVPPGFTSLEGAAGK